MAATLKNIFLVCLFLLIDNKIPSSMSEPRSEDLKLIFKKAGESRKCIWKKQMEEHKICF